jgi:hypothetical protein
MAAETRLLLSDRLESVTTEKPKSRLELWLWLSDVYPSLTYYEKIQLEYIVANPSAKTDATLASDSDHLRLSKKDQAVVHRRVVQMEYNLSPHVVGLWAYWDAQRDSPRLAERKLQEVVASPSFALEWCEDRYLGGLCALLAAEYRQRNLGRSHHDPRPDAEHYIPTCRLVIQAIEARYQGHPNLGPSIARVLYVMLGKRMENVYRLVETNTLPTYLQPKSAQAMIAVMPSFPRAMNAVSAAVGSSLQRLGSLISR